MVQALIDETYGKFTNVVARGRSSAHAKNKSDGHQLSDDWSDYADGRILSGTEALKLGFVDQVGTFDDAVKRAQDIAHISHANLIEYQRRFDLSDFLQLFGKTDSKAIKIDLGLDPPKLRAGYLYFLSPTFVR